MIMNLGMDGGGRDGGGMFGGFMFWGFQGLERQFSVEILSGGS